MGGGERAAGAIEAAVEEEDQIAGLHLASGDEVTALIILAGRAAGDGIAELLVYVVHQAGAIESAGTGAAGSVPAAQELTGHGGGGGAQSAGALIAGAHQRHILRGHIAGVDLIPTVAKVRQDVHHGASPDGGHLVIAGVRAGTDVEHVGGDEPSLQFRLRSLCGGDDRAVRQRDGEPLAGHVTYVFPERDLIPTVADVLLHDHLAALGGHGDGLGAGVRLAAQPEGVGGDGSVADGSERYAGTHSHDKAGGSQGPDRLDFELHWNDLHKFFFRKKRPFTYRPVRASTKSNPCPQRRTGRAGRSSSPRGPCSSGPDR